MKLIVQVPCYNEETTLPLVINSIPKKIPGVSVVETMIIDDGSSDRTVEVAEELGVNHIVRHRKNKGLAASFTTGVNTALKLGADILVNTDGDNQYPQQDIPQLIKPILEGTHDIVVADRQIKTIQHFSFVKKLFQAFGSKVLRMASGTNIPDAPSGFRAYSREALFSLNIVTTFSYCMETIVQAGKKKLAITHVPVKTNPKTRESRLFKGIFEHMRKSGSAIFRSYAMYEPFKIFLSTGVTLFAAGLIPFVRFAYLALVRGELLSGHIQSLIIGTLFMIIGFLTGMIGIIADLLSINRKLLEDSLYYVKKIEFDNRE